MSQFATLEEAFGVTSFAAPEPQELRGDVGPIRDCRRKRMDETIRKAYESSRVGTSGPIAEIEARKPSELRREFLRIYRRGGVQAAWELVPDQCREALARKCRRKCRRCRHKHSRRDELVTVAAAVVLFFLLR